MGRKVFISFLGTNNYVRCHYYFPNNRSDKEDVTTTRFVQEKLVSTICDNWNSDDRVFVFLTDKARNTNWINYGQHDFKTGESIGYDKDGFCLLGLEESLQNYELDVTIEPVHVKDGLSEEEIWDVFNVVRNKIGREDEIWLDITHGFRSLPMLGIVLINYLKSMKNIRVGGIFYGAFETLGNSFEAQKIALKERHAPIFDLTSFHTLQTWALGADHFVGYGMTKTIEKAIDDEVNPVLRETSGKDKRARLLRSIRKDLEKITPLFTTVRGKSIKFGEEIHSLLNSLGELREIDKQYPALDSILEVLENRIGGFKEDDWYNGLKAVEWCLRHHMVQQGITFFQETLMSLVLSKLEYDEFDKDLRKTCSLAVNKISVHTQDKAESKQSEDINAESKITDYLEQNLWLVKCYENIRDIRNDINHAGMRKQPVKPVTFERKLRENLSAVQKKLNIPTTQEVE